MKIAIRNDKGNIVMFIEVVDGHVVEDSLKGCFVSDIDCNEDGSAYYRLDISSSVETLENFSNQALLEEISNRMS